MYAALPLSRTPATLTLPEGTEITVTPTSRPGVNAINNVIITKGNGVVSMTGFTTNDVDTSQPQYERYPLVGMNPGIVKTAKNATSTISCRPPHHGEGTSCARF